MARIERRLRRDGYVVHNIGYPSRPRSLHHALGSVEAELDKRDLVGSRPLYWVTYSLGGLLARAYMGRHQRSGDRMVMLAPPNQGTEIVDVVGSWKLFRAAFGDLAAELGTEEGSLPRTLEVPDAEVGVIAGNRWVNPLGPLMFEEDHDGTVTVESTKLPNLRDHLVVPHSHTFLMAASDVARQTSHFLRHGLFERS